MAFQVGFHASHEEIDPRSLLSVVRDAEAAGFDEVMCSDHLSPWLSEQGESGYAWSWLGAAMAVTTVPFGVVTSPGQRQHPVIVSQAIATLAQMFPGRFWAALGSGEALNEHVTGDAWPTHEARTARLGECVDVMTRLLEGEEVSHRGAVTVDRARIWSRPERRPSLRAAAVSAETAAWAAAWADGLITVAQPIDTLRRVVDAYRSHGGSGVLGVQVHISFDPDPRRARELARRQWRSGAVAAPEAWELASVEDFERRTASVGADDMDSVVIVCSHSEELVERLRELAAVGFERLYLHQIGREQAGFLTLAAHHVLPALRGAA